MSALELQIVAFEEQCSVVHNGKTGRFLFSAMSKNVCAVRFQDKTLYKIPMDQVDIATAKPT